MPDEFDQGSEIDSLDISEGADTPTDIPENPGENQDITKPESLSKEQILEKRFKDTQAAYTRSQQKNAELARQLAKLEGRLEQLDKSQVKPEEKPNPLQFLDDPNVSSTLLDDPKNVIDLHKKTISAFAETLSQRDQWMLGELRKIADQTSTDDGRAIRAKVAELRADEDYSVFNDDQLTVIAKKHIAAKPAAPKKEIPFQGNPGGRRVAAGDPAIAQKEELVAKMMRRIYGNSLEEGSKK